MVGTTNELALLELAANFRRHLADDRKAFAEVTTAIREVGGKVDTAAAGLQARLGELETDRVRRDAVSEYKTRTDAEQRERKSVRENLGLSRRTWWLAFAVAIMTLAGVTAAWITVVAG